MSEEAIVYAYFFVGGALLLLVLLGLISSCCFPGLDKRSKQFFIPSFSILALSIVAYVIDLFVFRNPELAWVEKVVSFIETLLPPALMPILGAYILHYCGKNPRKTPFFFLSFALCALLFALLLFAQFSDAIYFFTSDNQFVRGDWYWVLVVPMLALIAVNLFILIRNRKLLGKRYFIAFLVYLLPLLAVMLAQTFVDVFLLIVVAVSISALSMFGIIVADQAERYLSQQREIADQRASIAVLQMRPHFIYNTMTSIYYLCAQDPEKAQQVTLDFTTYLRKNFNAIASIGSIPFADELEHTRAYLAVVEAQFGEYLVVEFDTPHVLFRLPPLTLQPLVENSVKYGMDVDGDEPLRVLVKTERAEKGSLLIVSDNGPGISPDDNGEPHVALNNIRERLFAFGASIIVAPNKERGTVVTIFIPDMQSK